MSQIPKQTKILENRLQFLNEQHQNNRKGKRRFVAFEPQPLPLQIISDGLPKDDGLACGAQQERKKIMESYQKQLWTRVIQIVNQKDHTKIRNLEIQLQEKTKLIHQISNQNKESRVREIENQRKQNMEKKQHQKLVGLLEQIQTKYNQCEKRLKQAEKIRESQQEQLIENKNRFIDSKAKLQNLQGINQSLSEQLKLKNQQIARIQSTILQLEHTNSAQQQIHKNSLQQIKVLSLQIQKLSSNLISTQQLLNSCQNQLNLRTANNQQTKRQLQFVTSQKHNLIVQIEQLKQTNQQLRLKLQNMDLSKNLAEQLKNKVEEMKELRKINQSLEQFNIQLNQNNLISNSQILKLKEINSIYDQKNKGLEDQIVRINQVNQSITKDLDSLNIQYKEILLEIQAQRSKNQQMTTKIRNLEEINKSIADQLRTKIEQIIEIRKIGEDLQSKKLQKQCQILSLKSLLNPPPVTLTNIESPFISIVATKPIRFEKNHCISIQYSQIVSSPLQQLNIARFVSQSSVPSSEPFLQQRQKSSDKSSENSQERSVFRMKSDYHRTQSIDCGIQIQQQFDYRNMQAKSLLLQKQLQLKTNEYISVSQLLNQKQNELYSMRQQFESYSTLIDQLRKRIQQLQKQPIIYHRPLGDMNLQQKMNHWHQLMNNINRNCLKNNCDSTGIINLQLNGIQQKNVIDFINLSPTDIEKFNKKQDNIDFNVDNNYGGNSSGQTEAYNLFKSEEALDLRKEGELKQFGNFSRKISMESDNYAEKEAAAFKLVRQKEEENRICHTQSQQFHNVIPAPTSPSKQNEVSECGENGKSLSICNNANSGFKLSYEQLHQKCLRTQRENEKMWEYLRLLHGLNHKWKKSSAEIDHQSKINVLVKLSQKLNNLLQRDRHGENQQIIASELGNLIKDVQSYIHFLDHLIKIQPFQDGHRGPYHSKKLQVNSENNSNHLYSKKTYSEGCCRQDDYVENFDIYPYEIDEIPREEELRKEVQKKQFFEMEKFNNQEKKDWFSEISSVKNQSQSEMSKSELIQLQMYMRGNFIREEADSFKEAKRDQNDSSKAEPKSFTEMRHMYQKLRDEYQQLLRQKGTHEKMYRKQIERVESQYIKKMSKMTKDFNDTFGLLCQRSGLHKREKPIQKQFYNRETQVDIESAPMMRKKSHSRTSFEDRESGTKVQEIVEIATQQLQFQLKDCQQRVKESLVAQQKLKESNYDLQRKLVERQEAVDKFGRLCAAQKKIQQAMQVKFASDFQEFIRKLTIKNKINDQSMGIEEKGKPFRKSSVSIVPVGEYIKATKIAQVKISSEFILRTILQMIDAGSQQIKDNINEQQFKAIVSNKLERYRKTIVNKVIIELVHKLQSLMHFEEQQLISMRNWSQAFEEYTDYEQFSIKSLSELCELMFKKSYSSHYLPINSKSNSDQSYNGEKHLMLYSRNSETELKKQLQEQRLCNQIIKKEKMELADRIKRLQSEMINAKKQLTLQQQSYSTLVANNPFEGMMHQKEKQIIQLQQEIMVLREQSTRLKLKSKKGKIIRIDH